MARVRISYQFPEGGKLKVDIESDLDSVAEVDKATSAEFRDAWATLEASGDQA